MPTTPLGPEKTTTAGRLAFQNASEQIDENIEAVAAVYEQIEHHLPAPQRRIEGLVAAVGRPLVLFSALAVVGAWIAGNAFAPLLGLLPLDPPPFFWLQGLLTTCSLLLMVAVLISQNRQARLIEQRAHLDLQVNLLAERKITKIVALLEELRRDSPTVKDRYDGVAEAMRHPADPRTVLEAIESRVDLKR